MSDALRRRDFAWLALAALLPLARVLLDPLGSLPGEPRSDLYKHVWSFWHVLEWPWLWSGDLNAPVGGVFLDLMWVPALLMAPVTLALGPVAGANAWLFFSFLLIGALTAALASELGLGRTGALAAGVVSQTFPYLLGYPLESGVHERLTVWVFPLVLLSLLRVGRSGDLRWALAGALGLEVATLGCQVYGVFAVILGLSALPLWFPAEARRHPARLALTLLLMAVALVGAWGVVRWAAENPFSVSPQPGRAEFGIRSVERLETASLSSLFNPGVASAEEAFERGDLLITTTYLGIAASLGGVLGALRRRGAVLVVVLAGLLSALLACGPQLPIVGRLYAGLAAVLPTYGGIPALWQQSAVAGPLLAIGVGALVDGRGRLPALAVVGVVLAERALVPSVPLVARAAPAIVSPVYRAVGEGALVEIPRAFRGTNTGNVSVFLAQTVHRQPLAIAVNVGSTQLDAYPAVLDGRSASWEEAVACFRRGGFRWVALHPEWFMDASLAQRALLGLEAVLGPPVAEDGEVFLFEIDNPERSPRGPGTRVGGSPNGLRSRPQGCPFG